MTKTNVFVIGKPHGTAGALTLRGDSPLPALTQGECLFIRLNGLPVPFFISSIHYLDGDTMAIISLDGVKSVEEARHLTGSSVTLPNDSGKGIEEPSALLGFTLIDSSTGQTIGAITSVDNYTGNMLFRVGDRLIPAHDDLIESIDEEKRAITMRLPAGLLDI